MGWHHHIGRRGRFAVQTVAACLLAAMPAAAEPGLSFSTGSLPPQRPLGTGSSLDGGPSRAKDGAGRLVVLGFAGDLGFSGSGDTPSSEGSVKHGTVIPWGRLAASVSPVLAADASFANLETVISESQSLTPIEKSYTFLGDPAGLRHAIDMGITVLTAANNHAGDFGPDGIVETLSHLAVARASGLKAFAGLGIGAARYEPASFDLGEMRVGVAAIGLAINHAGPDGPGQPLYASPQDFARVVSGLADTDADIRVLSVHYGQELVSLPGARDTARFRRSIDDGSAGIVFGHHSHVASGIEYRRGGLILYGLGNFMHTGTQDMSRYGACRDFGLYAKAYLWSEPGRAPVIRAVEVFPIRGMHAVPEPMPLADATRRIAIVNAMNVAVAGAGIPPVRLEPTSRASGLACFGDQSFYGDELAARCRASFGPLQQSSLTTAADLGSCGASPAAAPPPQVAAVQRTMPPIPVPRPSLRRPVKAAAAAEKPKAKGSIFQKLFD